MTRPSEMPAIISRADAKAAGEAFYFTGRACRWGHVGLSRVVNYACLACERDRHVTKRGLEKAAREASAPPKPEGFISLREAKALGLKRYFTGIACINGHITERQVAGKTCVACDLARKAGNPAHLARCAAYNEANREDLRVKGRIYRTVNAADISERRAVNRIPKAAETNARIAVWAKANPEKRRAKERSREARERGAEGTHTWADIEALKVTQDEKCAAPWCRVSLRHGFEVDHVIPIARNGSNWPTNLQLLCTPCNRVKLARDPVEWLQTESARRAGEHVGSA